jgi:hypothetical protein
MGTLIQHPSLVVARQALLDVLGEAVAARAPEAASSFVNKLLSLPDRGMRSLVLTERLFRLDVHLCLVLLQSLLDRSLARDPRAQEALLDLTTARPLMQRLGYARARALYELARRQDRYALARMLLSPETMTRREEGPRPEYENKHMQDTSLGWRKTLAKGSDRAALDRLLWDRNPAVVTNLLNNPRITERDVIRIAAMRPANPDCLVAVFVHERWLRRYRVKVSLALNPDTPMDIALTLLPQLMRPELVYASRTEQLDPAVREAAAEMVQRRIAQLEALRVDWAPAKEPPPEIDLDAIRAELEDWMAPRP